MNVYLPVKKNKWKKLKKLTKLEEFVLLAILNLNDTAYLVTIQDYLEEQADTTLSFGTLHVMLRRLEQAELVTHYIGEATSKRGGKAIKYFRLTQHGIEALKEIQKVNEAMWINFEKLS